MNFNDIISKIIDNIPLKENESLTINAEYSYPLTAALKKFRSGKRNIDCRGNKMGKQITVDDIIETYKCLISCRTSLPGMSLEEAFSHDAMQSIKKEFEWLKEVKIECAKNTEQQVQPDGADKPLAG